MSIEMFLDTAYAIALSSPDDDYHDLAAVLAKQIKSTRTRLVTTRAVMLEIGNSLSKQCFRHVANRLLNALESDPNVEIVPLSERLYRQAVRLYQQRPDKEWGLTDCTSFVVMQERGIHEALTMDDHFRQAGFRALLKAG